MMDYYSDFYPPSEEDVINEVTTILLNDNRYKSKNALIVKKTVKKALKNMGGHSSLGSLTGYMVFTKKELITKSQQLLAEPLLKLLKFKTIVKIIITMTSIYNNTLHNRYKPYGIGYYEAKKSFNEQKIVKLPPIGLKYLNTPIKENIMFRR